MMSTKNELLVSRNICDMRFLLYCGSVLYMCVFVISVILCVERKPSLNIAAPYIHSTGCVWEPLFATR